jgi:DNA polymerase-4
MIRKLEDIAKEVENRLKKSKVAGKTITLKIKYSDFTLQTRSKTLPYYISDKNVIVETVKELLYQSTMKNSVRLLGISLSNLNTDKGKPAKKKVVAVQLKFDF